MIRSYRIERSGSPSSHAQGATIHRPTPSSSLCTELDPALNPMTVIRLYLEWFVLGEEGAWSDLLVQTSKDLVIAVTALLAVG